MGYVLTIGNLQGRQVEETERSQAPWFKGDGSGQTNKRMISYSEFADFCQKTGLATTLHQPVMHNHPGHLEITQELAREIEQALNAWRSRHFLPAGWKWFQDKTLLRLIWLHWWTQWAMKSCSNPCIENR